MRAGWSPRSKGDQWQLRHRALPGFVRPIVRPAEQARQRYAHDAAEKTSALFVCGEHCDGFVQLNEAEACSEAFRADGEDHLVRVRLDIAEPVRLPTESRHDDELVASVLHALEHGVAQQATAPTDGREH